MEEEKVNRIGQDFSFWQLICFIFPSILTNLFSQIFKTLDDGLFVSRYVGKTALAGINILNPLHFLQFGINNLFSIGASNISSRKMGAGKQLEAKQVFTRVVISAFAVGSVFSLLVNIFAHPLLRFFGADKTLQQFAIISLRSVFVITPFSLVNIVFNSYFSTAGKPTMGLICSIVNGVTNVVLDVVLIVVMKIGVLGACISTVAGEMVIFVIGFIFFCDHRNEIYFVPPQGEIVSTTIASCKNGLAQSINCVSLSLTALLINHQLLSFIGNDGIAANSITSDLRRILTAAFFGYIGCMGPIISYHFGSGNKERLKKVMNQNNMLWLLFSAILTVAGLLLRKPLISIFIKSSENSQTFYELTYLGLTLEFISITFFGGNVILSRVLTAVNLQRASTVLAFVRNLIIRSLTIWILPKIFGSTGIWLASPVCELISFIIGLAVFFANIEDFGYTKKRKIQTA